MCCVGTQAPDRALHPPAEHSSMAWQVSVLQYQIATMQLKQ